MTAEQFVYWLQGYMEIANPSSLGVGETRIIKDHLDLVFNKKTPEREEKKEPGINLVYDFTSPIIPGNVNVGIYTKKMGSTPNYSYDPRSIRENWGSSNTLPTDKKKKGNHN